MAATLLIETDPAPRVFHSGPRSTCSQAAGRPLRAPAVTSAGVAWCRR